MKERLIRWLIGPHHTVIHKHLLGEYEKVAAMTPEQFAHRYKLAQMQRQVHAWATKMNEEVFTSHNSLFTKIAGLRDYLADKDARN